MQTISQNGVGERINALQQTVASKLDAARTLKDNGDDKRAFEILIALANENNPEAQYEVGMMYYHGVGVDENDNEAFDWLKKSADQGDVNACFQVGSFYEIGIGVEMNLERAKDYYLQAVNQKHVGACYSLGYFYQYGLGVRKKTSEALYWYRQANELDPGVADEEIEEITQGVSDKKLDFARRLKIEERYRKVQPLERDSQIQFEFGLSCCEEIRLPKNLEKAEFWFNKIIAKKNNDSPHVLALSMLAEFHVIRSSQKSNNQERKSSIELALQFCKEARNLIKGGVQVADPFTKVLTYEITKFRVCDLKMKLRLIKLCIEYGIGSSDGASSLSSRSGENVDASDGSCTSDSGKSTTESGGEETSHVVEQRSNELKSEEYDFANNYKLYPETNLAVVEGESESESLSDSRLKISQDPNNMLGEWVLAHLIANPNETFFSLVKNAIIYGFPDFACICIAGFYEEGIGKIQKSESDAIIWYVRALQLGYAPERLLDLALEDLQNENEAVAHNKFCALILAGSVDISDLVYANSTELFEEGITTSQTTDLEWVKCDDGAMQYGLSSWQSLILFICLNLPASSPPGRIEIM